MGIINSHMTVIEPTNSSQINAKISIKSS